METAKLKQLFDHLHTGAENPPRPTISEARANFAKHYTCPPVVFSRMHFWMVLVTAFALGFTFGVLLLRSTMRF